MLLRLLLLLLPMLVFGQDDTPIGFPSIEEVRHDFADRQEHFWSEFMNMLFMLGIIIFFIFALAWLARRLLNARLEQVNQTSGVKVIERRVLGPKSTIYVIEIAGSRLVIGETPMGLTSLGQLPNTDMKPDEPPNSFSQLMEKK